MAKKVEIELNDAGFIALLNGPEVRKAVEAEASRIARTAGSGYSHEIGKGKKRLIGKAYTATKEAKEDNMENNTLLKAAGASGWDQRGGIADDN